MTRLRSCALLVLAPLLAAASCAAGAGEGGTAAATGGSSPAATSAAAALAVCRQEVRGRDVVSGAWTTVGELRSWGYGNPAPVQPLAHVFPSAAASDQALWCWTKDAPRTYTVWGARARDGAQRAFTRTGPTDETPSGGPGLIP